MALTDYQRKILIQTMLGEAQGEGPNGLAAVAHVILNRAGSGRYPSDPAKVALQPNQFSAWNSGAGGNNPGKWKPGSAAYERAGRILDGVIAGTVPDITGGSLMYHAKSVNPYWANQANTNGTLDIGNHVFYPTHPVPPGNIPDVATLLDVTDPANAPTPAELVNRPMEYAQLGNPSSELLSSLNAYADRLNGTGAPTALQAIDGALARGQGVPLPIPRPSYAPQGVGSVTPIASPQQQPRSLLPSMPTMDAGLDLALNGIQRGTSNVQPFDAILRDGKVTLPDNANLAALYAGGGPTRPGMNISPTTFDPGDPLRAETERQQGLLNMDQVIANSTQMQPMNINLANALDMFIRNDQQQAPTPARMSLIGQLNRQENQPTFPTTSASDLTRGMSGTGGPILPDRTPGVDDTGMGYSWNAFQALTAPKPPATPDVSSYYANILPIAPMGTPPATLAQPYQQGMNTNHPLVPEPSVPKTITQTSWVPNPDYKPASSVPAGMTQNFGSRDTVAQAAAGQAAAAQVPTWIEKTVTVPNPAYTTPPVAYPSGPPSIIPQVPAPNTDPFTTSVASIVQRLTGQQGPNAIFPRGAHIGQSVINGGNVTQGANGLLNDITQNSAYLNQALHGSGWGLSNYGAPRDAGATRGTRKVWQEDEDGKRKQVDVWRSK